ncbi:MAG TPA: hypothetical protein DCP90_05465 [Clostridiales bacterium]|nr:MAG: hypothetical protein A2Y22_05600 [Clostridiales bacterium GWD2_32_59]HAN10049.1 hypothetical protein [Clostridiales bacterium]
MNNRERLLEILNDMAGIATIKKLECLPLYLAGGSACIVGNYLDRMTIDIDILDLEYPAKMGRLFNMLGQYDMLDLYVTSIADGFKERAKLVKEVENIQVYILSREDIIITKLGRYNEKDKEDISKLVKNLDKKLINSLIENVLSRKDFSEKVREHFALNVAQFRGDFDV